MHREGIAYLPGEPRDVTVEGHFAYVVAGEEGLHVIDVTDPASPQHVSTLDTPGEARGVAASGQHVYVADLLAGLHVVDVADPAAPEIIGSVAVPGRALSVAVYGTSVLVTGREAGLHVVDVTQPASPILIGTADTPGEAYHVALAGDVACVADSSQGLQMIDLSNPAQPQIIGSRDTPGSALGVAVSGSHAYVADGMSGLHVLAITNPSSPYLLASHATPGSAVGVAISGTHAFVADYYWSGLLSFDVSNPNLPAYAGGVQTQNAWRVATSGDFAFVASGDAGLDVVDISNPEGAAPLGQAGVAWADEVVVSGSHAYVLGEYGLYAVDASDPSSLQLGGVGVTGTIPRGLAVTETHAFVVGADFECSFEVFDIQDPMQPEHVAFLPYSNGPTGVAITGDHALVAYRHGLDVLRIDDPTQPMIVEHLSLLGRPVSVTVSGEYAYVASVEGGGFQVVGIADPEHPTRVATLPLDCSSVTIDGSLAYVVGSGVYVVDISAPSTPTLVTTIEPPRPYAGVAILGHLLYVAAMWDGVYIYDVANPGSPEFVAAFRTIDQAEGIAAVSGVFFVADLQGGLLTYWPQCEPTTAVVERPAPTVLGRLLPPYPSPFRSSTLVRYELATSSTVNVRIYDAAGRIIRVLEDGVARARGEHHILWDGRDELGRSVPSGSYFIRLTGPSEGSASRVLVLR
jgi:hypothetical protein